MLDRRVGAVPPAAPHAAEAGLESQAVLVGRPQLDDSAGVGLLHRLDYTGKLFLKAAWAAGSALAWRGLGPLGRTPRRWSLSPPR